MTPYPIEFHRRLEQKWASRIEQILTVTGTAPRPRDPNEDDDDEVEDEEDEDQPDEPAVVREDEIDFGPSIATMVASDLDLLCRVHRPAGVFLS